MNNPIIGLAPMDGITDAPFRFIVDKYGHPDVLFTEFVPIEGLIQGRLPIFNGLIKHETKTKTIAQLIGANYEQFYQASIIALSLGFNGIDINMGCPEKSVIKRGSGSALINKPELVKQIIQSVQKAVADWQNGINFTSTNCSPAIIEVVNQMNKKISKHHCINTMKSKQKVYSVSVKTRLGWDKADYNWLKLLLESDLDFISVHGRTVADPFGGQVDWDSIAKIVELAKKTKTKIWGNGDVKNRKQALEKAKQFGVAGVLIGRACFGNPWVFCDHTPSAEERKKVMIEHCQKFSEMVPTRDFCSLRKHLAWYCKGFRGSAKLRNQLMKVNNLQDILKILP